MKYDLMAQLCKAIISKPVDAYMLETFPAMDRKEYKRTVAREYRAIIERTESIGGIHNPFQSTMMICAYAIAAYRSARPQMIPAQFEGMIDAVCHSSMMEKMYKGKDEFSDKNIQDRIRQAEWTQTHSYAMDWKTIFSYVPGSGEHFITHTACGVCSLAAQEGVSSLVPYMCKMDYPAYELKGVVLDRTKTLGYGDECCNFHVMTKEKAAETGYVRGANAK